MEKGHEAVMLYFCFAMIITMVSDVTGQGIEGGTMNIACGISGTYTYPGWIKDGSEIITNEDSPAINGAYSPRFSYAADQKTLVVNPVNSTDAGSYVCSKTGLIPATTLITVVLPTSEIIGILVTCFGVSVAVCVFFIVTRVTDTVVIIECIHILISEQNEPSKGTEKDRKHNILIVRVILIIAAVIFLAVSGWFIGMQATVDAFQEMTQYNCNVYIGLLSFEVFDFVLDVCLIIYLFYFRDYLTKINPKPGDPEQPGLSPQHLLQTHFPPGESVSRNNVNLNPTTPNYKNIFTTEFRRDSPGSEQSNKKASNQGLSDQEYDQTRTKRLTPLDHTVKGESTKGKKKKKKTKTKNDVKFDNDND